jgi:bacterioferritin-associated ferredoxin
MYVCICNAVTDHAIRAAVVAGTRTFAQLRERTGCASACGGCEDAARAIFDAALAERAAVRVLDLPLVAKAA